MECVECVCCLRPSTSEGDRERRLHVVRSKRPVEHAFEQSSASSEVCQKLLRLSLYGRRCLCVICDKQAGEGEDGRAKEVGEGMVCL